MATKPTKTQAKPTAPAKAAAPQKPAAVPPKPAPAPTARPSYIPEQKYDIPVDDQFQPTIKIVQMISNEIIEGDPSFIPGAAAGMMFHSTSKELYDGKAGIVLVPIQVRKYYTEWIPRAQGGGFVAQYDTKEEMQASADQSNEIVPVFEFICILQGQDEMVRVQFNSATKYPVARKWGALIQEAGTMYGMSYKLRTVMRQNKQKQPYYTFDVDKVGWVAEDVYKVAEEMAKSVSLAQLPAPTEEGAM